MLPSVAQSVPQSIAVVDAFTATPYAGNPAGVCLLAAPAAEAWMQAVAIEMNHAETAFLVRRAAGEPGSYDLRWFTPGGEVDLCGHATLASAHSLWETGALEPSETARFHTRSGVLTAQRMTLDRQQWIELDFPAEPASARPAPEELASVLGAPALFFGQNRMDLLVELESEAAVRGLRPDLRGIAQLSSERDLRGLIVTARSMNGEADVVSRCFYPRLRIDEDPVTGSAHCAIAPYWMARLGKPELMAYQASARGGWLRLTMQGSRVLMRGQAVTTLRGELSF
jgi:PhzF family phenazine biosynthesis protein